MSLSVLKGCKTDYFSHAQEEMAKVVSVDKFYLPLFGRVGLQNPGDHL